MTTITLPLPEAARRFLDMMLGGQLRHRYMGDCPSPSNPESTDPNCSACHAITVLRAALEQPQAEPVAVHQFRTPHCSDWCDGVPDHHDGHGPYEVRTLYTAPIPIHAQPDHAALTVADVRKVGGIVHSDGNIFFTNIGQLNAAVRAARGGAA